MLPIQNAATSQDLATIITAVCEELRSDPVVTQRLYTVKQAGTYLGRTTRAIQSLIHEGTLTVVRIDSRAFLDRHDLDALIDGSKN